MYSSFVTLSGEQESRSMEAEVALPACSILFIMSFCFSGSFWHHILSFAFASTTICCRVKSPAAGEERNLGRPVWNRSEWWLESFNFLCIFMVSNSWIFAFFFLMNNEITSKSSRMPTARWKQPLWIGFVNDLLWQLRHSSLCLKAWGIPRITFCCIKWVILLILAMGRRCTDVTVIALWSCNSDGVMGARFSKTALPS